MGADIHIVVEKRTLVNNKEVWFGLGHSASMYSSAPGTPYRPNSPDVAQRDYAFFAALAGVRGSGPEPRGMPADASLLALDFLGGDDFHSHSSLSLHEFTLTAVKIQFPQALTKITEERLHGVHSLLCDYRRYASCGHVDEYDYDERSSDRENYRVVFAFDN